ncbi:hypothetical protein NL50_07210 [Clostridium acetobutylicum]|nr:hypothetical protein NL50_07210 [Clostridium acetobutylicum]
MLRKIIFIIKIMSIFMLLLSLLGCAPKGKPEKVLDSYYRYIKNNNAEAAYSTLCNQSKRNFSKHDFLRLLNIQSKTNTLRSFKISRNEQYGKSKLDGACYKNVGIFTVTENNHNNYENRDIEITYRRYVVNDNGKWKVYRGQENGKETLAQAMDMLASMYIDGKGENKDLNNAVNILNESIKLDRNLDKSYYLLGNSYTELKMYDEAIISIQKYLTMVNDNGSKSEAYNMLGVDYEFKGDYNQAQNYYNKAVDCNPNNQYAKTNLQRVIKNSN